MPRWRGRQLEMFDDIPIPPPREAKVWHCSECGQAGAAPEPGMLQVDNRYALGKCGCRKPYKGHTPLVNLIADFAFDRDVWAEQNLNRRMKAAYNKSLNGSQLKPEEAQLAARYRARIGVITNSEAKK